MKLGGASTLDYVPVIERVAAVSDADGARGKVVAVSGSVSSLRPEGSYFVGTLTSDAGPVYFVTPFAVGSNAGELRRFRGVFVQWHGSPTPLPGQLPALVLVGEFAR